MLKYIAMKNKEEKAINDFVDVPEENNDDNKKIKEEILNDRQGLIERVDKILVTKDGKQLLREQY
jgi:ubiquinone biosynthesis protein Coq4